MAKDKNKENQKTLTPEQKKREDERKEREKKEQEELKKKEKEKQERKKKKELREKKRREKAKKIRKKEQKRVKRLMNMPFKLLWQVGGLVTFLSFIIINYATDTALIDSLFYCFFIFTFIYLVGGGAMVLIFFLISEDKIKELEYQRELDEKRRQEEEIRIKEHEQNKLEELEKEISEKKLRESMRRKELSAGESEETA
ncbi:MAG: hypothetical protein ACOC4D_01515, partial [Bacteroidota bacterium]